MKKRILALCLALALLVALVPQFTITAAAKTVNSGTCGTGVNWTLTDNGLLTISGSGAMDNYESSSDIPWVNHLTTTNPPTRVAIQNIVVEDGVTAIGSNAFAGCRYLKSITIGADVAAIGTDALMFCGWLQNITVDADNQSFTVKDDVLFTKDGKTLLLCPIAKTGAYVIPNGTTTVADKAFMSCGNLTSIQMPNSVTEIGVCSFAGCISMTSVTISNGITAIPERAFSECPALESVRIPASVTTIGKQAFWYCSNLKEIAICGNVSTIGDAAFSGLWWDGVELTIAGTAPTFGSMVFEDIQVTAYYPGEDPTWTSDVRQDYGGFVTWVPYSGSCPGGLACAGGHFTDMPAVDNWAHNGIEFAIENGITTGTSATTFSPNADCTRGQVVAFLWRAAGCPEPISTECPFTDVVPGSFYYKATLWAVENGITSGTGNGKFSPNAICTRGQVVAFLWRAAGKPEPTNTECVFTDAAPGYFYYTPMLWAVENGITTGTSATTFSPDANCSRSQVVTFLYRAYN